LVGTQEKRKAAEALWGQWLSGGNSWQRFLLRSLPLNSYILPMHPQKGAPAFVFREFNNVRGMPGIGLTRIWDYARPGQVEDKTTGQMVDVPARLQITQYARFSDWMVSLKDIYSAGRARDWNAVRTFSGSFLGSLYSSTVRGQGWYDSQNQWMRTGTGNNFNAQNFWQLVRNPTQINQTARNLITLAPVGSTSFVPVERNNFSPVKIINNIASDLLEVPDGLARKLNLKDWQRHYFWSQSTIIGGTHWIKQNADAMFVYALPGGGRGWETLKSGEWINWNLLTAGPNGFNLGPWLDYFNGTEFNAGAQYGPFAAALRYFQGLNVIGGAMLTVDWFKQVYQAQASAEVIYIPDNTYTIPFTNITFKGGEVSTPLTLDLRWLKFTLTPGFIAGGIGGSASASGGYDQGELSASVSAKLATFFGASVRFNAGVDVMTFWRDLGISDFRLDWEALQKDMLTGFQTAPYGHIPTNPGEWGAYIAQFIQNDYWDTVKAVGVQNLFEVSDARNFKFTMNYTVCDDCEKQFRELAAEINTYRKKFRDITGSLNSNQYTVPSAAMLGDIGHAFEFSSGRLTGYAENIVKWRNITQMIDRNLARSATP
jgi:hypothetical protein